MKTRMIATSGIALTFGVLLGFWIGRSAAPDPPPAMIRWVLPPEPPPAAPATRPAWLARAAPDSNFDQVTLRDALEFLSEVTEVSLLVNWGELAEAGLKPDTQVTLKAERLNLGQVLQRHTKSQVPGVRLVASEEIYGVRVGRPHIPEPQQPTELRIYDMRRLLLDAAARGKTMDDLAPQFKRRAATQPGGYEPSLSAFEMNQALRLVDVVYWMLEPREDSRFNFNNEVHYLAGWLIVRTTPANHDRIAALLRKMEEAVAQSPQTRPK